VSASAVAGRLALAGLLGFVASCAAPDAGDQAGIEYRPAAGVERLRSAALDTDDVGLVRDFDLAGDTLYLLDRTGRVLIAERAGRGWTLLGTFGRRGAGPGEFLMPTGIALHGPRVVVLDGARLQIFTRDGELLAAHLLDLPCAMLLPGIAHSRNGLFVHGNCHRSSFVTDTLKSVLAWTADTSAWHVIAEDLRMTRDGTAGHVFTASSALTPSAGGTLLFGSGATNCIWLVSDAPAPPTAVQHCPAARELYAADPPAELRARLRSGAISGVRLEWPSALPSFVERIASAAGPVLLRPFSMDSLVLQLAAPSGRDLAVAPLEGLVGCKAAGCLWVLEDATEVRLLVLDSLTLNRRAAQANGVARP
jgi:hypothetical protein